MATAAERYQLYVSHVGDETRSFLASLDAQPEEEVRSTLNRKGFGKRMYLAHIWLDFRDKVRQEADDEECRRRINRAIEAGERVTDKALANAPSVEVTARNPRTAFISRLKSFFLPRK